MAGVCGDRATRELVLPQWHRLLHWGHRVGTAPDAPPGAVFLPYLSNALRRRKVAFAPDTPEVRALVKRLNETNLFFGDTFCAAVAGVGWGHGRQFRPAARNSFRDWNRTKLQSRGIRTRRLGVP